MELEATILERLQELRKWQVEQQERLLKQQQEQRDLLSFEQDRMYQALGLSVQGIVLDDSLAEQIQNSPIRDYNRKNTPHDNFISDTSSYKQFQASIEPEGSTVYRDATDYERIDDQPRIELNVPPLQLTTNRYLNFKSSVESFSPCSEIPVDREDSVTTISSERTPEKSHVRHFELSMDGVEPFPLDKPVIRQIALDDVPVPSPKKDFTTMLEERLRDCEVNDDAVNEKNPKTRVKRPFLKKGEGLARFRPNLAGNGAKRRVRPRSASLSASMHFSMNSGPKNNGAKLKDTPKCSRSSRTTSKNLVVPSVAQQKLSLKNVMPAKKIVRSKSASAVPNRKTSLNPTKMKPESVDLNISSDIETKNRRELEEMRIFELLEEKAENSSFCSNSSTVLALFRQSTPLKTNNSVTNDSHDSKQPISSDSLNKHEASDTSLEEIVRSTKTNLTVPGSPVTKIRETVIQKDYLISMSDENINTGNSNCVNRAIATGSYKSMKQTTIQFNNNNINSNNNNNVCKPTIHSDDEAKVFESSCKRNVDIGYNENYQDQTVENDGGLENERGNVSLHVRFSEYNEYKTIGLTDTSMMSNDSDYPQNYFEDKAWSDRSTSPDSSDVEVVFCSDKSKLKSPKALPASQCKKESRTCGEESTDQTTGEEDEEYMSYCSNDISHEGDNTITEINVDQAKSTNMGNVASEEESENCNDSGSTIGQEKDEKSISEGVSMDIDSTIFKSDLLKTRLLELEREIDIFRKENSALASQRKKLQELRRQLEKEFRQKEEDLEKERKLMEEGMLEERKRLGREKAALENRLRDAREKSLQNKQERQEIQILREKLDELREETSQKESRWQAAQARQKSQVRVLQTENARLKDELEKLRTLRMNNSRIRRPVASNTRAIHQINKHLESRRRMDAKKDSSSDEETGRSRIPHRKFQIEKVQKEEIDGISTIDADGSKTIVYNSLALQSTKNDDEPGKKRDLYANLLNDATEDLRKKEGKKPANVLEKSNEKFGGERREYDEEGSEGASSDSVGQENSDNSLKSYENMTQNNGTKGSKIEERIGGNSEELSSSPINQVSHQVQLEEKCSDLPISSNECVSNSATNKQNIREIRCPDGHTEFWYPNGNVKKIYPDQKVTKMIYYNGDVREIAEDGTVKYFYASTKTLHTTLPDGLEILEFADGQVERKTKNGITEVSFPDGSVRLLQSDGMEKWVLPDGTVAETFPDGTKILSFPNGQREVHTKEHKRREYPDGTMKLVYPDGTQETRYSTGRVRIKDKDGNLLMDVHHR